MASQKAQLVLNQLNADPQDRDGILTYSLVKVLASLGTDVGVVGTAVDDVLAQLTVLFPPANPGEDSYVVERVGYYLASMRDKMERT